MLMWKTRRRGIPPWTVSFGAMPTNHQSDLMDRFDRAAQHVICTLGFVNATTNRDLILSAANVLNPHMVGDRLFGNVAAELVSSSGTRYQGVCIDTGSGTGFAPSTAPSQPW